MRYLFLSVLLLGTTFQEKVRIEMKLNGELHDLRDKISLSEFEGSYLQFSLAEGKKLDPEKPLSGEIFIRAEYLAAYYGYFENLENNIYLYDSIAAKTNHRIRPGNSMIVRIDNIDHDKEIIFNIYFAK